jgi:hypothetical protein
MAGEVKIDPELMIAAADGINGIIDTLAQFGLGETAGAGRGFSAIQLSTLEAGDSEVQRKMESFAERWEWGIRFLVQSANEISQIIGLAAGAFYEMDQIQAATIKKSVADLVGNPNMSYEEAKTTSWEQMLQMQQPDYSPESFDKAAASLQENWTSIKNDAPAALNNLNTLTNPMYAASRAMP